jgi:hypothetical protein
LFSESAFGRFSFCATVLKTFNSLLTLGATLTLLAGCAPGSLLVDVSKAAWSGTTSGSALDAINTPLNPRYRYLRVELTGKAPALMVLGYLDPHPLGEIEVWYSSSGETLKLQNGRVVGAAGLSVTWLRVTYPQVPLAWASVTDAGFNFSRVRDELPGYRFDIVDHVVVKPLAQAPFKGQDGANRWFSESYLSASGESLPSALFGVTQCQGKSSVVYSFQCLSTELCLTIQPWPPEKACS